ncbi:hypothetical protein DEO72_LG3g2199 [Vigna unguiculata]|uniref:Uncharacterized protein n=1 Tax=Vigna unguiculata TaxID=3917 RepID=A0A4D6LGM2_VIGUN|nr:hypothetical protein DEO72_LG3g2199 [Vigna unguiculata]
MAQYQRLTSKLDHHPHKMIRLHTVNGVDDGIWKGDCNIFSNRYLQQLNQVGLCPLRPANRPHPEQCRPHLPAMHVHLDQRFLQVGNISNPGCLGLCSHFFPQRLEKHQILLSGLRHVPYNNILKPG